MAETVVEVQQKKWYQSKTVWLNVAATLSALIAAGGVIQLDPQVAGIIATLVGVANVILRVWFTGAPVTDTGAVAAESGGRK